MPPSIHAQFLGGYRLQNASGEDLPLPATHHARLLLAYLLLHEGRSFMRAYLAGTFWPDLPEKTARRRLSQALWRVRQIWDGIAGQGNSICIREDARHELDVTRFQQALRAASQSTGRDRYAHLQQALALYQGPLLNGYYEDWLLLQREQLHEHYLKALESCAEYDLQRGAYSQALKWALRLEESEPLHEGAHRLLIHLYDLLEQREQAVAQYEKLRQLLANELSAPPSAATEDLFARVQARARTPRPSLIDSAPLFALSDSALPMIGREDL